MKYVLCTVLATVSLWTGICPASAQIKASKPEITTPAPQQNNQEEIEIVVPDNEAILRDIVDQTSPYYYPKLMTRYRNGDTTLTLDDYRHLYYGYAWQPSYKPLEIPAERDKLLMVIENNTNPTVENFEKIIEYGNKVMESEPFNPGTLNFLVYAYGSIGDTINERINHHRMQMVMKTITSSGTGIKESSPWHVLYFTHPTDILASMSLINGKRMVVSRTTEFIPLITKIKGVKGYYSDFSRIYWNRPDKTAPKKKTGWEFNGIPIKKRSIE